MRCDLTVRLARRQRAGRDLVDDARQYVFVDGVQVLSPIDRSPRRGAVRRGTRIGAFKMPAHRETRWLS